MCVRPAAVLDPRGDTVIEPLPRPDDDWLPATRHHHDRCGVYLVSQIGLADYLDGSRPNELFAAAAAAGRLGHLLAITATVR